MCVRRSARSISLWVFLILLAGLTPPDWVSVRLGSDLFWTQEAHAQINVSEDELFQQMIAQAGIAYKESRFQDAIKYFEDAMLLRSNPNIHWNLSVCYYKLKNLQKSLYHINLYLKEGNPSKDMKNKVESRRRELLGELKRKLDVTSHHSVISSDSMPNFFPGEPADQHSDQQLQPENRQGTIAQASNQKTSLIWGIAALGSFAISTGVHLYADSIWASRPSGGGSVARQARDDALTTSWTGDAFLAVGLTAAVISFFYYLGNDKSTERSPMSQCVMCDHSSRVNKGLRWGMPIIQVLSQDSPRSSDPIPMTPHSSVRPLTQKIKHTGAVLGWHLSF